MKGRGRGKIGHTVKIPKKSTGIEAETFNEHWAALALSRKKLLMKMLAAKKDANG